MALRIGTPYVEQRASAFVHLNKLADGQLTLTGAPENHSEASKSSFAFIKKSSYKAET